MHGAKQLSGTPLSKWATLGDTSRLLLSREESPTAGKQNEHQDTLGGPELVY